MDSLYLELCQKSQYLEMAGQLAHMGYWRLDLAKNTLEWSPEIYLIHGVNAFNYYPETESAITFYHPDDQDVVKHNVQKAIETGEGFSFTNLRIIRPCGEMRYVNSKGKCLQDHHGKILQLFGIFQDVTDIVIREKEQHEELNRTKEELIKSQSFLQLIMDYNPVSIFVKAEDFTIVQANQAFINNYPEEQQDRVIGYTTLERYNPAEANEFLAMDRIAFKEGYSETTETLTMPNGSKRTLFTEKVRFEDVNGKPFILGVSQDVTQRETLISRLQHSNEELMRFAYICSHDLQEPLRMIASFSEMLEKHLETHLINDEKAAKYFHFLKSGASRGQELIASILKYCSVDHDISTFQKADLNQVINQIQDDLITSIQKKDAHISAAELPTLHCNKTQMYQLFMNLITNGLKYQPENRRPTVTVSCKELLDCWHFAVADNGIGIPADQKDTLFEVFKRLHTRAEYIGNGIGLAICKKIALRHQGTIWIESEEGSGSTFHFTISKNLSKTPT